MRQRWLPRLGITAVAVGIAALGIATPAWADTTAPLHEAHKNKLAEDFEQECDDARFQGLGDDEDGWHFVLTGNGSFTSITVSFDPDGVKDDDPSDDVTFTGTPDNPGDFTFYKAGQDWKHAYLFTPAGWLLVDGSATVAGGDDTTKFVVSHTCAGEETPTTPPTSPTSPSESTPGETSSAPGGGGGGTLPLTGTAVGGIVVVGVGLVAAGVALMAVRRRREIDLTEV
jgi:LPXTG-motif cell wall-anchored protein